MTDEGSLEVHPLFFSRFLTHTLSLTHALYLSLSLTHTLSLSQIRFAQPQLATMTAEGSLELPALTPPVEGGVNPKPQTPNPKLSILRPKP